MEVSIPLFGPSYSHRSQSVGNQLTQGFYPDVNRQSNEQTALMPFPGLTVFSNDRVGACRGLGKYANILFSVNANTLYSIDSNGTSTAIGNISGTGRCVLTNDGFNLVITTGETKPYAYDGTSLTLGTDTSLANSSTSAFINKRVVYDGDDGDIIIADVNEPLSVTLGNVVEVQSQPDATLAAWAFKQQLYAAGEETIQPYWNPGDVTPAFQPVSNSVQQIGVKAKYSIAYNKEFTYFLGSDLNVYRYDGLSLVAIGDTAICQAIASYVDTEDAYGAAFSFDSLEFYLLTFFTGNQTWLFNEQSGLWTNLTFGEYNDAYLAYSYIKMYGKHLIADRRNGELLQLDFDAFTDNGEVIQRRRQTVALTAKLLGLPGRRVTMNWLRILLEPGVSQINSPANMIMEYSDDDGHTWSSELWSSVGPLGDYEYMVEWAQLGTFYKRMFRFTMTDPVKWVLIDAVADVEVGLD